MLRAGKLAQEFGRSAIILGSGTEFQRLHAIAAQAIPMVVPLAFREKPRVDSVGEQESVDLGDLMTWEQAPTNPRRLDAAGLTVALTTSKARDRAKFLESLREAIKHGLTEDHALAMVTTNPASILGTTGFGTVEQGQVANLVVSDGPVFAKDSKILEVWIDGRVHEVSPPAGSARGEWTVAIDPPTVADLRIMVGPRRPRARDGGIGGQARA